MRIIDKEKGCLEGTFRACGHTVRYIYFLRGNPIPTNDVADILTDEAENRAREMIADDYVEGELNCELFYTDDDGEEKMREYRGWWSIRPEEEI